MSRLNVDQINNLVVPDTIGDILVGIQTNTKTLYNAGSTVDAAPLNFANITNSGSSNQGDLICETDTWTGYQKCFFMAHGAFAAGNGSAIFRITLSVLNITQNLYENREFVEFTAQGINYPISISGINFSMNPSDTYKLRFTHAKSQATGTATPFLNGSIRVLLMPN